MKVNIKVRLGYIGNWVAPHGYGTAGIGPEGSGLLAGVGEGL